MGGVAVLLLAACGWVLGATLVVVLRRQRASQDERRLRIERALHELRRPLGALALLSHGAAAGRQLDRVIEALEDLDTALHGVPAGYMLRPVSLRPLVEGVVERWSTRTAALRQPAVELRWSAGQAQALADPRRLAQALENLIANAIEHGRAPVVIEATTSAAGLRLMVRNRVGTDENPVGHPPKSRASAGRGHGLGIVSRIVRAHGGRFLFDCDESWAVGTVELPIAPGALETAIVP